MKRLLLFVTALLLVGAAPDDGRKANDAYENGDYAKAETLYRNAIQKNSDNPKLYFNLGNTLVKQGKYKDALNVYEHYKTMVNKPDLKSKADYNIGNVYAEMKQWQKAMNYYKQSLHYDTDDHQAKHNYELAYNKLQDQKKKNKKQNKNNNNNKNNKNQKKQNKNDNKKQQQNQNQRKNGDNKKQNQQNNQNQNRKNDQNKQQPRNGQNKQQQRPNKITKAQAQKILQALENKEKALLKRFKKQNSKPKNPNGKDW